MQDENASRKRAVAAAEVPRLRCGVMSGLTAAELYFA